MTKNPTVAGCYTVSNIVCPQNPCFSTTQCVNGSCVSTTPLCVASNLCETVVCLSNGTCVTTAVSCPNDNANCLTGSCNSTTGSCISTQMCPGTTGCMQSTCMGNGQCSSSQIPNACDDGNPCTTDTCITMTGTCTHVMSCTDGVACTQESCDVTLGCVTNPDNSLCDDNDACTTDICTSTGCTHTPVVCNNTVLCSNTTCDVNLGCQNVPYNCAPYSDASSCKVSFCPDAADLAQTNYTSADFYGPGCVIQSQSQCFSATTIAVISGALGSAAVAGICVALVVFVACSGAASYAVYNNVHEEHSASVKNNALYVPAGKAVDNPLYAHWSIRRSQINVIISVC